eukprot:TRINITY_DN545_c0_g1_i1.p1 TRINITY_DN545_c0_g1~~TRINITY_DN545_c0_g1_i1.p1  ORF type:complete len:1029 (-),score=352.60 TRINITY_DN545_c0_g1_i1:354-3440(-)
MCIRDSINAEYGDSEEVTMATMLRGNKCIGIVKEIYSKWERRCPLTPSHVKQLVEEHGLQVLVQPSKKRVFADSEFVKAGAIVTEDLSNASVIFGVKQVPVADLLADRTYVFFSHTIKAQAENMPLLDELLDKNIRLIDYECITAGGARSAPRLVAFGEYAGKAGMIDGFRGIGERLLAKGYHSPFLSMGSAYMYEDYEASCRAVQAMGEQIAQHGVHPDFAPMTFVFTGNGNVSRGAQEVFKFAPHEMVSPADLPHVDRDPHKLYGCVVEEEFMVRPKDPTQEFVRSHYYQHPEQYEPQFHEKVAPYTSMLMNCTYWDNRYPRLLTIEQLREMDSSKLIGVGDVSCDIGGSLEFLTRDSQIEDPFFMYNPVTGKTTDGVDGDGIFMLGVDILPSELPREASHHFGQLLTPFVPALATSNAELPFAEQADTMPAEMHGAVITSHGQLTPSYAYISKMREEQERASAEPLSKEEMLRLEGSTVLQINGHLYDTGLINQILNLIENKNGRFSFVSQEVQANLLGEQEQVTSAVSVQITIDEGRTELDHLIAGITALAVNTPYAEATVHEVRDVCKGTFDATLARKPQDRHTKDAPAMSFGQSPEVQTVLILGAGLVAAPAVEYLSRDPHRKVVVASALASEATAMVKQFHRANVSGVHLDAVADPEALEQHIKQADAVLSLIPAPLHPRVASSCIRHKTNLVTASYVSPEMGALQQEAKDAGVSILCEMGLDPGMDHMSAKAVIDEVYQQGGKVTSFTSVCGGLPAPEAANNPLGYKFSWSPRGVLTAAQNASTYLWEGEKLHVPSEDLLCSYKPISVLPSLSLEQLPNRDAMPYGDLYGLRDAHTIYRGTLRYAGWSAIMYNFRQLGLLSQEQTQLAPTWDQLLTQINLTADKATPEALATLQWLGAFSSETKVEQRGTVMDAFCALMESKMAYAPHERDMALMHHEFGVESGSGSAEKLTSTFLAYGDDKSSAMAKTVGLTAAIGVDLVMGGQVSAGVHAPTLPEVYKPGLKLLAKEGIVFDEQRILL